MPYLPWILAWYALASLVTFSAFTLDKRAAARGTRRTRERTLHLLELAGGWPGALAGAHFVRHKNRKWSFLVVTIAIAALHMAGWACWVVLGR